jgi:methionyl-tRNA formyltransferase
MLNKGEKPDIIIALSKEWLDRHEYEDKLSGYNIVFIHAKDDLSETNLDQYDFKYIFFPHWSFYVPSSVYDKYECVIFHMTDLPYGRGGSPLQNLINRKIYKTKITALQCSRNLDSGDIYMKKDLDLSGCAQDIYIRAGRIILSMIKEMIENKISPVMQDGEPVYFQRREPAQSEITNIVDTVSLFDHIRMLDADGYPTAFLEKDGFRYEFRQAELINGDLSARVRIIKIDE